MGILWSHRWLMDKEAAVHPCSQRYISSHIDVIYMCVSDVGDCDMYHRFVPQDLILTIPKKSTPKTHMVFFFPLQIYRHRKCIGNCLGLGETRSREGGFWWVWGFFLKCKKYSEIECGVRWLYLSANTLKSIEKGVVAHIFRPNSWEAKSGRLISEFKAILFYIVSSSPAKAI